MNSTLRFKELFTKAALILLLPAIAKAQEWAPDSLVDKIFTVSIDFGVDPFAGSGTASVIFTESGTRYTFSETGDIAAGQVSTYTWQKTSANTGVSSSSTEGFEEYNSTSTLTFENEIGGRFETRLDSDNSLVQSGAFAIAPANKSEPLVNLSTRTMVAPGSTLISGFVIGGAIPQTVIIRAVGSELVEMGVSNALSDTELTIYNFGGDPIHQNDDWESVDGGNPLSAAFQAVGAFELDSGSGSAAVMQTLEPGLYTIHVREEGTSQGGEVLLEVYLLR